MATLGAARWAAHTLHTSIHQNRDACRTVVPVRESFTYTPVPGATAAVGDGEGEAVTGEGDATTGEGEGKGEGERDAVGTVE